jgi:hypothetical protein
MATLRANLIAMFIGHFGVAFAAKRLVPRTSLATLILAAQFLDFLWPIFLVLGFEHVRIVPGITKVQPFDFYDYPFSQFDHGSPVGVGRRADLLPATPLYSGSMGGWRSGAKSLGAGFFSASPRSAALAGRSEVWTWPVELVACDHFRRSTAVRGGNLALRHRNSCARWDRPIRFLELGSLPVSRLVSGDVRPSTSERASVGHRRDCDVDRRAMGVVGGRAPGKFEFTLETRGLC